MMMLRWKRVEVSGGAMLLGALLYYLDNQGLFLRSMLACGLHELGHYLAILALGGEINLLRITCIGAEMRLSGRRAMKWWGQMLAELAGPLINLGVGYAVLRLWGAAGWYFAGINFALAAFNLLPAGCLDGGRALSCLLTPLLGSMGADRCLKVLACALAAGLLVGAVVLFWHGSLNLTLLILSIWLLAGSLPGKKDLHLIKGYGKILRTQ